MEQLIEAYKSRRLILFVGAGVSMGLGLPSWNQLIDHIARELGYDPDVYRTLGTNLALAEYYRIKMGRIGPLRSWMDREWHSAEIDISKSRTHATIATAEFELIYTTNYDRWIERAFEHYRRPYMKIARAADIATARHGVAQVVKFHGDLDDDESIVLDESSYFERLGFESPLDIKLRSDVLGRSVLFIGYGLADVNIRWIFYRLAHMWRRADRTQQPKSYYFSSTPNPVLEATLAQWNIQMITSGEADPGVALAEFLAGLVTS